MRNNVLKFYCYRNITTCILSYSNYAAIGVDGCSQSYVVLSPFRIVGGGKPELLASDIECRTVGRGTE